MTLEDSTKIRTRCVLVASGVMYRKLDVPRFEDFDGAGIYYAATEMEAKMCDGEEVVVIGAGNSAGQAVVNLARHARRVLPGGPHRFDGQRHHLPQYQHHRTRWR